MRSSMCSGDVKTKRTVWVRFRWCLVGFFSVLVGLCNDAVAQKVYWAQWTSAGKIQRANLDGTDVEELVTGLDNPGGLALDQAGGKMYWIGVAAGKIQRANLDGSMLEDLVIFVPPGTINPGSIALDTGAGKMYWGYAGTDKIQRANLDGSGVEVLITGLSSTRGMALDLINDKIFWTGFSGAGKIQRANLDGTGVEDVLTGRNLLTGIALHIGSGKMYWLEMDSGFGDGNVWRSNLDGSNIENVLTGLSFLSDLALDIGGNRMYWTNTVFDKIEVATLSGFGLQDVLTGLIVPTGIALDLTPSLPLSRSATLLPLMFVLLVSGVVVLRASRRAKRAKP